ncbi:peptidylprolyl isomerase [Candidatus Bipolaricaulota bacterium]|nr:peptidylprolyl isomerase [Candidatus Bipolaricaulota bacterium]
MRIRSLVLLSLVVILMFLVLSGCNRDTPTTTDLASNQTVEQVADVDAPDLDMLPEETHPSEDDEREAGVIAHVNNVPISNDDFERSKQLVLSRYQQIYSQFGQDVRTLLAGAQGRLFELRIEDEALELATTRALILEELDRRNAPVSEDELEAEFQKQYAEFLVMLGMSEQEFQEALETGELAGFQAGDLTFDQFISYAKQTVREEFEIQAVQRLIAGTIEHSEEELIAFFEERRSEYDIPEQVRASHILLATEEQAQQLHDELADGADFATLAREHSTDTGSGARGGDLGWFERGQMVAPFEDAAFSTPAGELSEIVPTEYGYHIIWVTDYQSEEKPEYEDVADLVTSDFEADIMAQRFNQWYTAARPMADISIEDLMLDAFRKQQADIDQGLQAFLKLRDEVLVDDLYLDYIIATIYETKMDEAQSKKLGIEGNETITPSQQEQINALETEIETNRSQALASYRAALTRLGENAEIEARIQALEPIGEVAPPTE